MTSTDAAVILASATIEQAFRQLNESRRGILFAVSQEGRVEGCVTDGDIRRQLLMNNDLSTLIASFMNRNFAHAKIGAPREQILKLLDHRVHVVPLLDDQGRLASLCSRDEFHLQEEAETFARARAPARISFGGGGTDLTHFFFDQGGVVISTTIAKYAHATLRWRKDVQIRIYSHDLKARVDVGSLWELHAGQPSGAD